MCDQTRDGTLREEDEFNSFGGHNLFNVREIAFLFSFSFDAYTLDVVWSFWNV